MYGTYTEDKVELDDMKVLFPNQKEYETEDTEALISMLHDKDKLIERLWFELKDTREQERLLREYAGELERKVNK